MATLPGSSQELVTHMNEQRQAIGDIIEVLRTRLKREWNLRRQFATHSGLALGATAMLGFALGRALRRLLT